LLPTKVKKLMKQTVVSVSI